MQRKNLINVLKELDKRNATGLAPLWHEINDEMQDENLSEQEKLTDILEILLTVTQDDEILTAAMLYPMFVIGKYTAEDVKKKWSLNVLNLIEGVRQLDFIHELSTPKISNYDRHQESLRKMLLSMSKDIRVVFIKLAEQLYAMRKLKALPQDLRQVIARETKEIFAPLANRLGIWVIKWELEDLSFRELNPNKYKDIASRLEVKRAERESYVKRINSALGAELVSLDIPHEISGRSKHIYSIWRKMQLKELQFDELFDLRALRVLTDTVANCYSILGVVHNLWTPIPREFDDYISNPKPNNYQSLHTAVRALDNDVVEVQIRTFEMHEFAESGVAAHWRYKEQAKYDAGFEAKVKWLRQLLDWQDEVKDQPKVLDDFSDKLAEDHIYVLTPEGEVMELPMNSTPLDFAYAIHTELGHRTRGAKVDGKIVPLTCRLKTTQKVEILTTKNGKPARDWLMSSLGYLRTSSARAKVKTWFRKNDYDDNVVIGKSLLFKEAKKLRVDLNINVLVERFNCDSEEDMLAKIALGIISISKLAAAFQAENDGQQDNHFKFDKKFLRSQTGDFVIEGVGQLLTNIATCCNPLPGDSIVGFVTKGRGVSVHRADCTNALHLVESSSERILEVNWLSDNADTYQVQILVEAYDRPDLLKDLTVLFANEKIKIISLNSQVEVQENINKIKIGLEIKNLQQLSGVLHKLEQFKNVIAASRI